MIDSRRERRREQQISSIYIVLLHTVTPNKEHQMRCAWSSWDYLTRRIKLEEREREIACCGLFKDKAARTANGSLPGKSYVDTTIQILNNVDPHED